MGYADMSNALFWLAVAAVLLYFGMFWTVLWLLVTFVVGAFALFGAVWVCFWIGKNICP